MSDNPERPYIGRIIAMWQDEAGDCRHCFFFSERPHDNVLWQTGLCWTRVRWFYRKEDTSASKSKVVPVVGIDALSDAEIADREVFASLAEDDNLLSTVDGVRLCIWKIASPQFIMLVVRLRGSSREMMWQIGTLLDAILILCLFAECTSMRARLLLQALLLKHAAFGYRFMRCCG